MKSVNVAISTVTQFSLSSAKPPTFDITDLIHRAYKHFHFLWWLLVGLRRVSLQASGSKWVAASCSAISNIII
jgi:hypothetical protein